MCYKLWIKFCLRGQERFLSYLPSTEIFSSSFLGQGTKQRRLAKNLPFFLSIHWSSVYSLLSTWECSVLKDAPLLFHVQWFHLQLQQEPGWALRLILRHWDHQGSRVSLLKHALWPVHLSPHKCHLSVTFCCAWPLLGHLLTYVCLPGRYSWLQGCELVIPPACDISLPDFQLPLDLSLECWILLIVCVWCHLFH